LPALRVVEARLGPSELLAEYSILLEHISDGMSLFALQPAGANDEKSTEEKVFHGDNVADRWFRIRLRAGHPPTVNGR
jgi:hypothetical protein